MSLALSFIEQSQWAITEEGLNTLISVASRTNDLQALENSLGRKPSYAHNSTVRQGIGIIPVQGPTFKRANLLTEVSGATSYEIVLRDLHAMIESSEVKAILLNIDSPGGEANGCAELGDHIFSARQSKPIYAYVGGLGASAAYWIASSCCKIFASETALLGSIGVQTVVRSKEKSGEISFVSSISPNKNRDPGTELGSKEVQRTVDDLGAIFVHKVARNRGISPETVLEKYGQGSIFIGEKSLEKGMIDEISSFEGAIMSIAKEVVEEKAESMESSSSIEIKQTTAEIEDAQIGRILKIQEIAKGRVSSELTNQLIKEKLTVGEAALRILTHEQDNKGKKIEQLKKADSALANLDGKSAPSTDDDLDADLRFAASIGLVTLA
ncbi:MAG TPA: S49 family peptidase [Oligoflexus sp.]|uniref:S49 family peptidase n=1 Tax=Oligoflexus sp. TaxID=1971216 RepID=UPI002D3CD023|nr:S49 family peptidase [Oligoflexus sp.]HYX35847.1 S49 family peptidase [Oligoflexus sp.]